ncbi:XrtA/PEP-CTERM system-associated ATPase [Motiliproteus sp. MSK22-1]|uniref:XrtA/PEP-CTERM system-associated ATPase n=1 Tax=Motiliproteus sp. MSK22-1 TaxID=1897630 RepID=UPI000977D0DF|nr:XrtA/PEP-CTERM system-associated ATPase [Motiliproteus sp. MSK22-1]OMH25682.1 ATPase [Motiliproteus sp. MSK22-1]
MYESYFGLIAKPFQLSPDPDFFFSSKGHKRALSYLQYGLGQGEGFIVVTGEVGTGKTTLMRNLLKTVNRDNVIAAQLVTTKLESDDLLRMICASFGLPAENKPKAILLQQFEGFLRSAHQAKKRVLLVVDEAQNLPAASIEELRMLSNFQLTDAPLLQSFLLGQPELRAIIQDPSMEQFRQRIIASCHLKALGEKEVREYILWRLSVAGWAQNPKFSDLAFDAIHANTGGIPRRINIFCDRLLLFCFLEETSTVTREVVDMVAEELAEEMGPDTTLRMPVVPQSGHPAASLSPQATIPAASLALPDLEPLQEKIDLLNSYFNESLEEKIQMLKVIDKKFNRKLNAALGDKSAPVRPAARPITKKE